MQRVVDAPHMPADAEDVHREEAPLKKMKVSTEVDLAQRLVHHPAEHLREPVVDAGEDREDDPRDDVVDVGDDEVGVVDEDVDRRGRHEDAAQAADDEHRDERQREEHRRR